MKTKSKVESMGAHSAGRIDRQSVDYVGADAFAARVVAQLDARGIKATWEFPGFISVDVAGGTLAVGTSNGDWGYDFTDAEGRTVGIDGGPDALPMDATAPEVAAMVRAAVVAVAKGGVL